MSAELYLKDHRGGAGTPPLPKRRARRLGVFVLFLALLALTAPLLAGEYAARRVGMVLLIACHRTLKTGHARSLQNRPPGSDGVIIHGSGSSGKFLLSLG